MKLCKKCRLTKDHESFYTSRDEEDNLTRWCIECITKREQKRRDSVRGQLYYRYMNIVYRCENPEDPSYGNYGARGISNEFRDFDHFYEWSVANGFEKGLSIDRRDNDGNYSPDNCRWVGYKTQNRNTRSNRIVEAFGESKPLIAWTEDPRCPGVSKATLRLRLNAGWEPEEAITKPVRPKRSPVK